MSYFSEENAVEEFIRDLLCGKQTAGTMFGEPPPTYQASRSSRGTGWQYVPVIALPRQLINS